jgi:hypothetical protein
LKITKINSMGLDNVGDGSLIRVETDAGIVGYGEAGLPSAAARSRIDMMAPQLTGQDPLAIERHFYMMAATQYSFMANIPTVSGGERTDGPFNPLSTARNFAGQRRLTQTSGKPSETISTSPSTAPVSSIRVAPLASARLSNPSIPYGSKILSPSVTRKRDWN